MKFHLIINFSTRQGTSHSLCLIVLESHTALGVRVLLAGFCGALHGAVRDDDASAGPTVAHHAQGILADTLHQLHVSLREAEDAAMIVVQDHHCRQTRRDEHRWLRHVTKPGELEKQKKLSQLLIDRKLSPRELCR